ncbi:hypothetical protein P0D73_45015 [Paraburkholderia sp. RL18-101-BIB-B]|uniref:hypothetical protein n=1 Tax=Paraburkholderia sp. RL18-101-BIB-B TaxID=3031634 RepID=UPI0038B750D9
MRKALSRGILVSLVITLSACGTVPPIGSVNGETINAIRTDLSSRADEYQTGSKAWGNKEFWNNGPLILFGAGSVAAASFASGAAKANWLVGLALAAGVWALTYSTLAPETKQDAYSAAATQFSCLASSTASADDTINPSLTTQQNQLTVSTKLLATQLGNAADKRAKLPTSLSSADQVQVLKADALVDKANEALTSANTELSAHSTILPTLKNLLYTIDRKTQLAARGKVLTPGDVNGALASAGGTGKPPTAENTKGGAGLQGRQGGGPTATAAPSKSAPVQDYVQFADAVTTLATNLTNTPIVRDKTYSSVMTAIKQCVTN